MPIGVYERTPKMLANIRAAANRPEVRMARSARMMGDKNPNWGKTGNKHPRYGSTGKKSSWWGRHHTPEAKAKARAAKIGDKNPAWLGGITGSPYAWTFNAELKEEVRRRDGYACQLCGVPQAGCERKLAVHHIDYDKKNSDPVNLTALCVSCNVRANHNRPHWTELFQAMAIERDIVASKK